MTLLGTFEIDAQREGHIMESDNVSQFLAASELGVLNEMACYQ